MVGNNFTEWTKVKEAKTYFEFQVQPKIPLNSNYYDITNGNVIKWQIDLAKQHNVFGFCLYHYWSNGKRILSDGVDSFYEIMIISLFHFVGQIITGQGNGRAKGMKYSSIKNIQNWTYRHKLIG